MAITMEVQYNPDHMDRRWEIGEVKSKHSYQQRLIGIWEIADRGRSWEDPEIT